MPRLCLLTALAIAASLLAPGAAGASSIVFVKDDAIWATTPDGSHQVQVTREGKFASPSQADDGTIVALDDASRVNRFDRRGLALNAPFLTWLGINGGSGFSPPYRARVSPDGTKVAFAYFHSQEINTGTGNSQMSSDVSYTYADRATPPETFGHVGSPGDGWTNPEWVTNDATVLFWPDASTYAPGTTNAIYHHLGRHDPASGTSDSGNAWLWFDDAAAPAGRFGAMTRQHDKLAVGNGDSAATTLRLYAVSVAPPSDTASDSPPAYRCSISADGATIGTASWSPDGQDLAFDAGSDTFVAHVGDLSHGCGDLGAPHRIVTGGTSPSWGPADVSGSDPNPTAGSADGPRAGGHDTTPPRVGVRLAGRALLARVLRLGLRLTLSLDEPGTVTVSVSGTGRSASRAHLALRFAHAGSRTVTLTVPRSARRALRRAHRGRLTVTAIGRDAAGNSSHQTLDAALHR